MRGMRVESRTGIIHLGELMRLGDGAQVRRKGKEGGRCSCHFTVQRRVTAVFNVYIFCVYIDSHQIPNSDD